MICKKSGVARLEVASQETAFAHFRIYQMRPYEPGLAKRHNQDNQILLFYSCQTMQSHHVEYSSDRAMLLQRLIRAPAGPE